MHPTLTRRTEAGRQFPVLVWHLDRPLLAISTAVLGGGLGPRRWVINTKVPIGYDRSDPDAHLAEIARELELEGPGVGLMTAVDVADRVHGSDGGVHVTATVGLGSPGWAAAPDGHLRRESRSRYAVPEPGTVNIVATLPVRLSEAALVNAVATATEAKAQALWELGVAATGTATDAVCLLCPIDGEAAPYGGPRSTWGARLARAVHAAVLQGGRAELR
ncbi:MAG TPA: adenosylcobinamide amidohydrolase [Micromonosporaceae bacterium]|nr:adenosylcobinamide amidohydrolase [Micromonosporaceae bacterium]